ncbi:MAG: FemAB family protein [Nostocaceae cyanobacterium]|nr:FemAB family protein [Nostocaceae cyanobacterium]
MDVKIIDLADSLWMETLQNIRHDIYHLPEYLYLESRRIKATPEAILIADGDKIFFLPYLLRQCQDIFDSEATTPEVFAQEVFDIISPNGYCGILLNEAAESSPEFLDLAINELMNMFRKKQICSGFLRLNPILNQRFPEFGQPNLYARKGETVSVDLTQNETDIWQQTRPEHRTRINKCKRAGFTAKIVPFQQYVHEFTKIYEETMERVGASKAYYFGYEYFAKTAELLPEYFHLGIVELSGEITCAGLFGECCGIVQYHLGGTRTNFLKQAPSKLMFDYVRFWAKERGNQVLHLGGGVGNAQDSLYHFKAGFSQVRNKFLTLRLIPDMEKYQYLVRLRAKSLNTKAEKLLQSNFFPAYRCSP